MTERRQRNSAEGGRPPAGAPPPGDPDRPGFSDAVAFILAAFGHLLPFVLIPVVLLLALLLLVRLLLGA